MNILNKEEKRKYKFYLKKEKILWLKKKKECGLHLLANNCHGIAVMVVEKVHIQAKS
jgi:hypothetical protein